MTTCVLWSSALCTNLKTFVKGKLKIDNKNYDFAFFKLIKGHNTGATKGKIITSTLWSKHLAKEN